MKVCLRQPTTVSFPQLAERRLLLEVSSLQKKTNVRRTSQTQLELSGNQSHALRAPCPHSVTSTSSTQLSNPTTNPTQPQNVSPLRLPPHSRTFNSNFDNYTSNFPARIAIKPSRGRHGTTQVMTRMSKLQREVWFVRRIGRS